MVAPAHAQPTKKKKAKLLRTPFNECNNDRRYRNADEHPGHPWGEARAPYCAAHGKDRYYEAITLSPLNVTGFRREDISVHVVTVVLFLLREAEQAISATGKDVVVFL